MIELILIPFGLATILLIYLIFRTNDAHKFRMKLLDEECEWTNANIQLWAKKMTFGRFDSLPSFNRMVLVFWVPLSHYKRNLKPIEEYYDQ